MNQNLQNLISLNLASDGACIKRNFVEPHIITDLNSELDTYFSDPTVSTSFGVTPLDFSVRRLISPTRLSSVNVLELALSVFFTVIPKEQQKDYLICEIQVNSEKSNPYPLNFHTDSCKKEIRAQIYLRGGEKYSGGFLYMCKTHLLDLGVKHHLESSLVEKFRETIVDYSGKPGDLVAFDAAGFHGKHVCLSERRTIMFTFYPRSSGPKETLDMNTGCISQIVLENIELFVPNLESGLFRGWPKNFRNQPSSIQQSINFRLKLMAWSLFTKFKARR